MTSGAFFSGPGRVTEIFDEERNRTVDHRGTAGLIVWENYFH